MGMVWRKCLSGPGTARQLVLQRNHDRVPEIGKVVAIASRRKHQFCATDPRNELLSRNGVTVSRYVRAAGMSESASQRRQHDNDTGFLEDTDTVCH